MKPFKVISVASQLNNGKNTVCDYLLNKLGPEWEIRSFAKKVKDLFCDIFNVDHDFIDKWKRIPEPPPGFNKNVRESLIFIGDGMRSIVPDIWFSKVFEQQTKNILISDCRYIELEAEKIKKIGGLNILLWRKGYENDIPNQSEQDIMPFINQLKSEPDGLIKKDIPFHLWLRNDVDTLEELHQKIDNFILPHIKNYINH